MKRRKVLIPAEKEFISWATLHIVFGVKLLYDIEIKKINESETKSVKDKKIEIEKLLMADPNPYIEHSIQEITKIVEEQKKNSINLFSYDKFFKENSTNLIIRNHFENIE